MNAKRHIISEDWEKLVDTAFGEYENDELEKRTREEKAAILKELAVARLSVLIGGAGTGKTTLLLLLRKSSQIRDSSVLLLAPTGKARVRISRAMQKQGISSNAKTVVQFLIQFVGDPKHLPPIGAGRPFVDLVRYLKKDIPAFPRVGKS